MASANARGRFVAFWLAGLVGWIAALALISPYDLAISTWAYRPHSRYGEIVRYYGEWPGIAFALLCLFGLLRSADRTSRLALYRPLWLGGVIYALAYPVTIVQVLKAFWGRVRFIMLSPGLANFTPFYVPAGVGAGDSFPSGHAAIASAPIAWPLFDLLEGRYRRLLISAPIAVGYQLAVAWGRIVAGRHYATDVLFSIGVGWLLNVLLVVRRDSMRREPEQIGREMSDGAGSFPERS